MKHITMQEELMMEALIDSYGLSKAVRKLAEICEEKSDHIASSYEIGDLSEGWLRRAHMLGQLADDTEKDRVSELESEALRFVKTYRDNYQAILDTEYFKLISIEREGSECPLDIFVKNIRDSREPVMFAARMGDKTILNMTARSVNELHGKYESRNSTLETSESGSEEGAL